MMVAIQIRKVIDMSGIFGFLQDVSEVSDSKKMLAKMQSWNRAYGKEAEEAVEDKGVGLGCCYEKISVDTKCSTPVLKKDSRYAVMDALLYNRDELMQKCEVQGDSSDEELLFYYIEKFGINALKDVNGDFSGAIYDEEEKTLTLFRDHMGVRPLFYYAKGKTVAFSTDIRGILSLPQVDVSLDEEWIFKTIAGYAMLGTENTEFAHIYSVAPAGYMTFSFMDGKITTVKNTYWRLGSRKIKLSSEREYQKKLRELIADSVKRRLDVVPGVVGAEMSGGLDSSVIDILINRFGREGIYFSWSLSPEEVPLVDKDERIVIADICKQENITCNYGKMTVELGEQSNIAERTRQTGISINQEELPAFRYALPPYINTLPISESAQFINKNGAGVVFTGHGGDEGVSHRCNAYELFCHHEYYRYLRYMWSTTHGQKARLRKTVKKCYKNINDARKELKRPFRTPFGVRELLNAEFADKFREKDMPILHFAYDPKVYVREGGSRSRLDNVALLGAYCGVRYLVPYLDYRVIDYAVSIPRYLYLKGKKKRYIFREAFKDIMPKTLYNQNFKEDVSWRNVGENPNRAKEFAEKKEKVFRKLDRDYWGKYLNFDVIDAWINEEAVSEEDKFRDESILGCLYNCALADNLVKKAREID